MQVVAQGEAVRRLVRAVAVLDVSRGLAEVALQRGLVRPVVEASGRLEVEGGRHLVVEDALRSRAASFVPNDLRLQAGPGPSAACCLLTGPNMGGKSTFLRQNAQVRHSRAAPPPAHSLGRAPAGGYGAGRQLRACGSGGRRRCALVTS